MINSDLENIMIQTVETWGFPETWEHKGYMFKLNETRVPYPTVDLCIVNKDNREKLKLEFSFIEARMDHDPSYMDLTKLVVHDPSDRKNGVATFYLTKFESLCLENSIKNVWITPAHKMEDVDPTKAYSSKEELTKFYKNRLKNVELKFR